MSLYNMLSFSNGFANFLSKILICLISALVRFWPSFFFMYSRDIHVFIFRFAGDTFDILYIFFSILSQVCIYHQPTKASSALHIKFGEVFPKIFTLPFSPYSLFSGVFWNFSCNQTWHGVLALSPMPKCRLPWMWDPRNPLSRLCLELLVLPKFLTLLFFNSNRTSDVSNVFFFQQVRI